VLTDQRKRHILDLLKRDGAGGRQRPQRDAWAYRRTRFRRDFARALPPTALLLRVPRRCVAGVPRPFADLTGRRLIATGAKVAIGRAAAGMIRAGQVVILDGGTTTREVARHPRARPSGDRGDPQPDDCCRARKSRRGSRSLTIGGRLFKHSMVAVGAIAIEAIQRIRADVFFIGRDRRAPGPRALPTADCRRGRR